MVNDIEKWNSRYVTGDTPWETGAPQQDMLRFFNTFIPTGSTVLDVGCGVGTNAEYLAGAGYKVSGIDVSVEAIAQAKKRAEKKNLKIEYAHINFLKEVHKIKRHSVIFDCAVFHIFSEEEMAERLQFVDNVAKVCVSGGYWVNISCSKDGAEQITIKSKVDPPPLLSLREIITAIEPHFEVVQIQKTLFPIDRPTQGKATYNAWISLFRKRD